LMGNSNTVDNLKQDNNGKRNKNAQNIGGC
jgi:hypothetical protein